MLYQLDNYTANIPYLINTDIKCYDISKANISILFDAGLLSRDDYSRLYSLPKKNREIEIGIMSRDNEVVKETLKDGFLNARRLLIEANGIKDESILSIKKDAVYVINRTLKETEFGSVKFKLSDRYTSFYRLADLEIYFNSDFNHMDVKGINDNILVLHKDYFQSLLSLIFLTAEKQDIEYVLTRMKTIISMYAGMEFDAECYREFNRLSSFRLVKAYNILSSRTQSIGVRAPSDSLITGFKKYIDISYNYGLIIQLYNYYFEIYLNKINNHPA